MARHRSPYSVAAVAAAALTTLLATLLPTSVNALSSQFTINTASPATYFAQVSVLFSEKANLWSIKPEFIKHWYDSRKLWKSKFNDIVLFFALIHFLLLFPFIDKY